MYRFKRGYDVLTSCGQSVDNVWTSCGQVVDKLWLCVCKMFFLKSANLVDLTGECETNECETNEWQRATRKAENVQIYLLLVLRRFKRRKILTLSKPTIKDIGR